MLLGFVILAMPFATLTLARTSITFWSLWLPLVGLGLGVALAGLPATNDTMAAIPVDSAGVCSIANDAEREVGAALGIGVPSSLAAIAYPTMLDLEALPESTLDIAGESAGRAFQAIEERPVSEVTVAAWEVSNAFAGALVVTMAAPAITAVLGRPRRTGLEPEPREGSGGKY